MPLLTEDDLIALVNEARHGRDPREVASRILDAVDNDGLADPTDTSFALSLVAEDADRGGDLERATALMRRAVEADRISPGPDPSHALAYLSELLIRGGQVDEGMAQLAALRPRMATEVLAGREVAEALEAAGRPETAVEWLTEALAAAIELGSKLDPEDDESIRNAEIIYDLAAVRHRMREDLELGHDEYDELFHELDQSLSEQEAPDVLLFWPQPAFERLRADWPSVAEAWEPTWDEHRLGLERTLQQWWGQGFTDVVLLVASPEALTAYAETEQLSLADLDDLDEAEQGYLDSLADDPQAVQQPWPPRRNDPCWCGSGDKYKKCCLIRSRT